MVFDFGEIILEEEFDFDKIELDVIKEQPLLVDLEITPTTEEQTFNHEGEYGYDKVIVNPIPDEYAIVEGTIEIKSSGEYDVASYQKANVDIKGADIELENSYLSSIDGTKGANITKLPIGITEIGDNAFYRRTGLGLIEIPETVKKIGTDCFYGCINFNTSKLPSGLTSIGVQAFNTCSSLTLDELPEGLTRIENYTFSGCTKLALSVIPKNINFIGGNALRNCTSIIILDILSENLTKIDANAFYGCKFEKLIIRSKTVAPLGGTNVFTNSTIAKGTGFVYVPDDLVDDYKSATYWSTYANQIKGISELS